MTRDEFAALCAENKTAALLELWDRLEAAELHQAVIMGEANFADLADATKPVGQ